MKIYISFVITIISSCVFAQEKLEVIKSEIASPNEYVYSNSLDDLHDGEKWGFHSRLIGKPFASSCLDSQQGFSYSVDNIGDLDLKTAWVEGQPGYGKGEYIAFIVKFDDGTRYGSAGQFYGKVEVFNGYCKSEKLWKKNSRVKILKMYLNSIPICLIELQDTWQYQSFFIGKFFKNVENNRYMNANYNLNNGDELKFEIVDVYPGEKYKDVAISEFVADGAPN